MSVTGYAYPWDFIDDPDVLARTGALGLDVVALASSYHAARVVNMYHPTRRVTEVPYSAFYGTRRDDAWRGHRLAPRAPEWLGRHDAFSHAAQQLSDDGTAVDAWIVLTHIDDPDFADLELVERNAYDEAYPYALCPASEAVREYCLTLVDETLRSANVRGVVLEASGPMGFEHASTHDKSEFAQLSVAQRQLLSLCFCAACREGQRAFGLDPDEVAARARAGIDGDVATSDVALGHELADVVAAYRLALGSVLREAIIERVREVQPRATITVHASGERWATGSFPALSSQPWSDSIDAVVANAWDSATAGDELRALSSVIDDRAKLGAYLRLDREWSDGGNEETLGRYADAGVTELHLYHLGLLTPKTSRAVTDIIEKFREIVPSATRPS